VEQPQEVVLTVPAQAIPEKIDVKKATEVIFQPNPGPQTEFLSADEQEVLYGGAAGGGKSYAMLADPVRYLNNPFAKMLLVRKTTEELRELISVSKSLYPRAIPGIKWLEREKTWVAPSGASLWMSYLDADDDVTRYQGQAFCVSKGTKIVLGDGSLKEVENIEVGDFVESLEGPQKVLWKSPKLSKPCVKVSVYSTEGHLLSSQIHPDSHPIALLSSVPWKSLADLCCNISQFQRYPLQWLSYTQLESAYQENPETAFFPKGDQNGYTKFEGARPEAPQPLSFFYPAVRLSPVPLSNDCRVSTQSYKACRYQQQSEDLFQETSKTSLGFQQPDEPSLQSKDHIFLSSLPSYGDDSSDLPEKKKAEGSLKSYSVCSCQYGVSPLSDQEVVQDVVPSPACVEVQDPSHLQTGEKGCIPLCNHYLVDSYSHPYTQEQRELKVPLELCIVRVEPLEVPFCEVYDLSVNSSNSYITESGIVNKNCWIGFDELTQWSSPYAWNYMRSRLRSTKDSGLKLYQRATSNPGGAGNSWVKKTFITPAPYGQAFWATDAETGEILQWPKGHSREGEPLFKRRFIPATLFDNPYLAEDGIYEANLMSLPEHQRKQLLEGNWDSAEGAAFPEFNRKVHVIDPFDIPSNWPRFRAADYGYSSYSGVLWFAVSPSEQLIVYRELYVSKVLAEDLADMVLEAEQGEKMRYGVLDSSLWHKRGDTGPSIAERMIAKGCRWRPADRSKGSRVSGKNEIHRRLQIDPYTDEPRMLITSNCRSLISQLPSLPLSKSNPEDVDTNSEDHLYDALRYGCSTRPRSHLFDIDNPSERSGFQVADSKFGY
jgi:hypothetical protein